MKKNIIIMAVAFFLLVHANVTYAFTWWKTCIEYDTSFTHHIDDTQTLTFSNSQFSAVSKVLCAGAQERHAFSFYESGRPLHPDSAITIPENDKNKICKGDMILVYDDECVITSMDKNKRGDAIEVKVPQTSRKNESFILIKRKEELEKLDKE